MKSNTNDSINYDACISEAQWLRYLKDQSPLEEQRKIDRHVDNCPFCSDALEGALAVSVIDYETALNNNILGKTNLHFMKITTQLTQFPKIIQSLKIAALTVGIVSTSAIAYKLYLINTQVKNVAVISSNEPETSPDLSEQKVETNTAIAPTTKPIADTKAVVKDELLMVQSNETVKDVAQIPQNEVKAINTTVAQSPISTPAVKIEEIAPKNTKLPVNVTQNTVNVVEAAKPNVEKKAQEVSAPVSAPTEAKKSDENIKGDFFIGHQMFQQKKFGESIPLLENAVTKAKLDNTEQNLAYWDLANAHIKKSNYAAAKKYCKLLIEGQSYYEDKARELLKTIDRK